MSVSEHISVFISIVVGLAVADLLISFRKLLEVGSKVRWYWPTLVLAMYALLVVIGDWWGVYSEFSRVGALSVGQFLPALSTVSANSAAVLSGPIFTVGSWLAIRTAGVARTESTSGCRVR